jgi:hypothetical protein
MLPLARLEDRMLRTRTISYLLALAVGAGAAVAVPALAGDAVAEAKSKKAPKKKKAPPKKVAPAKLTAEQKKARAELMGSFKFGMSKDDVIKALSRQLDERYAELIKETQDVYRQDQLRKEKARELGRFKKSFVDFTGQKSGWDVSIVDEHFKHGTGESMLDHWENQDGKNQRRFFFFHDNALYKMFVQIDTTQFGEAQQSFDFFAGGMKARYGADVVDPNITHVNYAGDIFIKAIDKTRFYDAFCLLIVDPARARKLDAIRKDRIQDVKQENKLLKAVIESGDTSGPDLDANADAVQGIIRGGKQK